MFCGHNQPFPPGPWSEAWGRGGQQRQAAPHGEAPAVLSVLTGSRKDPALPAFSTFQPSGLTNRSCPGRGLLPRPGLQALKPEEAQPSLRALAVQAAVSGGLAVRLPHLPPALPLGRTCQWTQANWETAGTPWGFPQD